MTKKVPIPMAIIGVFYLLIGFLCIIYGGIALIIGVPKVVPPIIAPMLSVAGFVLMLIGVLYIYIGKGLIERNYTAYLLGFALAVLGMINAILMEEFLSALINFIIMLVFIKYEDYYKEG